MNIAFLMSLDHFYEFARANCPRLIAERPFVSMVQLYRKDCGMLHNLSIIDNDYLIYNVTAYEQPYKRWLEFSVSVADPTSFDQIEQKLLELNNLGRHYRTGNQQPLSLRK